eukprot:TRINITY_DN204_c0_g2_i1.p1 TRINITY_DN204_c0_g2~~TRINITY_DN204_c0_g2_i1.p1  ORF type:complete len:178 (+),score=53.41 TRINITY_DN204_c0_g2_i1:31-534(+)
MSTAEHKDTGVGDLGVTHFKSRWREFSMPACAEKTLALLVRYLNALVTGTPVQDKYKAALFKDYPGDDKQLETRIARKLVAQFQEERFSQSYIDIAKTALQVIASEKNLAMAMGALTNLLRDVREFDVDVCLEIVQVCAKKAELLAGKDAVFLLGGTGAGTCVLLNA